MDRGRAELQWAIASAQMALLANINRDTKKHSRPFNADDFNPLSCHTKRQKRKGLPATDSIMNGLKIALERMYCKGKSDGMTVRDGVLVPINNEGEKDGK